MSPMSFRKTSMVAISLVLITHMVFSQGLENNAIQNYQRGVELLQQDRLLRAIQQFEYASQLNPRYAQAYWGLSEGYFLLGEYDEAQNSIQTAISLAPGNISYKNQLARILLAQGIVDEADSIFTAILAQDPYNKEALLGKGELLLATQEFSQAQSLFLDTLSLHPRDRRVLLSLTLVLEAAGRRDEAERYLQRTLDLFSENYQVQFLAGKFYADRDEFSTALGHLNTALTLNPDLTKALHLKTLILIQQEQYAQALEFLERALRLEPQNSTYWYSRGLIQYRQANIPQAIESLKRGLSIAPYNEMVRLFLESIAIDNLGYEDDVRRQLGEYRTRQGQEYLTQNRFSRAAVYIERAVSLLPTDPTVRLARASLLRAQGKIASYVEELQFIVNRLNVTTIELTDALEVYEYEQQQSVSSQWGIQQFQIPRDYIVMPIFYRARPTIHPEAGDFLALALSDLLMTGNRFSFTSMPELNGRFRSPMKITEMDEAFMLAREQNADFYLVIDMQEDEREVYVSARIYLARTGRLVWHGTVTRTGNERVMDSLIWLENQLYDRLPFHGSLIQRRDNRGLINLGQYDGVQPGDTLQIADPNQILLSINGITFSAEENALQGLITIDEVDSLVSSGTISSNSFFDTINHGDSVLFEEFLNAGEPLNADQPGQSLGQFPSIYAEIRDLR